MRAAGRPLTVSASWPLSVTVPPAPASTVIVSDRCGVRTTTRSPEAAASSSPTPVSATSRPRPMTTRWSAVSSSSLIRWLETNTARPRAASSLAKPLNQRMPSGSRPLTGSSNSSTGGSPSSAAAMPSRCRMPSEKPPVRRRATVASPTVSSTSCTRRRGRPPACASHSRWSQARRPGCSAVASSSAPTSRSGLRSLVYGLPPTRALPASAASSPRIRRMVVDLPAPLGPTNPVTRPGGTVNERSSTATVRPNRLVRPRAWMVASMAWDGTARGASGASRGGAIFERARGGDRWLSCPPRGGRRTSRPEVTRRTPRRSHNGTVSRPPGAPTPARTGAPMPAERGTVAERVSASVARVPPLVRRAVARPDWPLASALGLGLAATVETLLRTGLPLTSDGSTALLLNLLATVPLALRRRRLPLAALLVIAGAALALGDASRQRGQALAERDASRRAMADALREQAAVQERARIARELHDVVAHHVSMIAVQAETARLATAGMPEEGRRRLEAIGATARDALGEMRRLLAVLRADVGGDAERAPQPGLDRLDELLDSARAAGTRCRLTLRGQAVPLPPGVDLAAYRIVQEALTNARRHAPG